MTKIERQHLRLLEAILFAAAEPLSEKQLAARLPDDVDLKGMLDALRSYYEGRGVELTRHGKSWSFRTADDIRPLLEKEIDVPRKLSRAAIETLAIVAYHQPLTRAEMEEIRGVSLSKGTLDVLMEAGWIKPGKRRDTPGRPATWKTTDDFLDHFGLEDVRDLPGIKELKATGLLESGPAINAYRVHGGDLSAPSSESEQVALLPDVIGDDAETAAEPLDPEGP
ncbi:MAG: SMC-Scp complex subunit ScpB [Rhodospirillaceae bacterium]|mgnify:FL=1|jgi:segregation and condensation protein B|nr:SMC-Scp complex subunit ScpB [Rhodospirillaceae bacterium]MBT6084514.1 SMC-Scp complex subunit ScpB [Rhodospirillaceae bacterium]MBT6609302.1 SMC-Scp complex subunit ScpB [Rhodospirillaceae bacterium]MBT6882448.1 SMC-Scp complex subunit ScpB [Rhodospirillaceae bacterium]